MKRQHIFALLMAAALCSCGGSGDEPETGGVLAAPSNAVCDKQLTTATSLTFVWDAVDNADGYDCKLTSGGQLATETRTTETHITIESLTSATTYTFQVRSVGSGAWTSSSWSRPVTVYTSGDNIPDKVVAKDGSGDCLTVAEAIAAIPNANAAPYIIYVKEGTYKEKLLLPSGKDNVTIVGAGADKTIITYDDYNGMYDGETSYCFRVDASDVRFVDLTLSNTFVNSNAAKEQGITDTQAMAVEVRGDRVAFYDCNIEGYQDTFYGRYDRCRIYVQNCYVEGNVDFIYGAAVMVFDRCTTFVNRNNSVLTAPSTSSKSKFGIVFLDCNLTAPQAGTKDFNGTPFAYFHLGRPWKDAPKSVFIRCTEPATLHPDGWTTMNDVDSKLFAEWNCTGDGAKTQRANGGVMLSDTDAAEYTIENIFKAATNPKVFTTDWVPEAKPQIIKTI